MRAHIVQLWKAKAAEEQEHAGVSALPFGS